jgi:hypothetical protein
MTTLTAAQVAKARAMPKGHVPKSAVLRSCWPWLAGKFDNGYGAFDLNGKNIKAHRFAYELTHERIPVGLDVLHSCDNRPCCNPHHLWVGTCGDNIKDRDSKFRQARGERIGAAKLTGDQIQAIRSDPREQCVIAKDYGVCKSTIGYVKRGQYWSHVR